MCKAERINLMREAQRKHRKHLDRGGHRVGQTLGRICRLTVHFRLGSIVRAEHVSNVIAADSSLQNWGRVSFHLCTPVVPDVPA